MTFFHSGMLWALPLALIPILIYYLMRFRSLRVSWGANYVLERALERLKKQLYLDQLILLALRVLACVALVLAFARPMSSARGDRMVGTGVHRILVLDASYSMRARNGDTSLWQDGMQMVRRLVETWGRNERWSLYVVDDNPGWRVRDGVVTTPEDTWSRLNAIQPAESRALLAKALQTVLAEAEADKTEIYLLADDQAHSWQGVDAVEIPGGDAVPVYWLHPRLAERNNLAVTAVTPNTETVLLGHPCRVFARLRNFGSEPMENVAAEILLDGRFFGKETLSLQPGQEGSLHLDVYFDDAGSHAVTVRLGSDALPYDNAFSAAVSVRASLRVLVLRDAEKKDTFDSAYGFLNLAANVLTREDDDGNPLFTRAPFSVALCEGPCTEETLDGVDVVVLDGGRTVTAELVDQLQAFLNRGGALILPTGETIDPASWNRLLGGRGLLPAPLDHLERHPLDGKTYATLARSEFADSALRPFATEEDGDLTNARLFSWYALGNPVTTATVLAPFNNGLPAVVRKRFHPGAAVMLAFGLEGKNASLVVRETFYPFLLRLLSSAVDGADYPRTVQRGEPIRMIIHNPETIKGATFNLQGDEPQAVVPVQREGQSIFELSGGASRTGLGSMLIVRGSETERVWIGVQGPRVDSDLTPLTDAERERLQAHMNWTECNTWNALDATLQASRRGVEWYHWAILALLLLLAGEMWMQRRFV